MFRALLLHILLIFDVNILMEKCISILMEKCISIICYVDDMSFFVVHISEVVTCMGDVLDHSVATGMSPTKKKRERWHLVISHLFGVDNFQICYFV